MKKTNKNGITLIALVITIIVLLILAGVSISMLSGENGVVQRAAEAKLKTMDATAKEQIQLAVMSAMTEGNGKLEEAALKRELKKNVSGLTDNDITGSKETGWQVKTGGKKFSISTKGETIEVYWEEVKDENGMVTEIRRVDGTVSGLKIGDTIGYNAANGVSNSELTITSSQETNGFEEQTISLNDYNGTWKLLGVENGKLNLISSGIAGVPKTNEEDFERFYFVLQGKTGYQNAENELNRVCSLYGKGKYAESARSINVDDINKISGYNPNAEGIKNPTAQQIASGNKYGKNQIYQYGNRVSFEWDGTDTPKYTSTPASGQMEFTHNWNTFKGFLWWNGKSWEKSEYTTTPGKICDLISDYYWYYPETLTTVNDPTKTVGLASNSVEKNMIFDGDYYWLASKCTFIDTGYVSYMVRGVGHGILGYFDIVFSIGAEDYYGKGLRPVVSLQADIKMKKDANNVWQIID